MDVLNTAKNRFKRFTDTLSGTFIPQVTSADWQTIGTSVRGFSHIHSGLPNQDALKYLPEKGIRKCVILSVADGHGSKNYFRSDIGSRLAVETACEVCSNFLKDYSGKESVKIKNLKFRDVICREIVRKWKEKINTHISNNAFTPDEELLLQKKQENQKNEGAEKIRYRPSESLEEYQFIPYGTTVLSIIVTEKYILYLQLGDGDILTILPNGTVSRPIPKDERLIANETTSLCLPIAWEEFRVRYQPVDSNSPVLIMVSSDGYSTSFSDVNDFEKAGTDILKMIIKEPEDINKGIDIVNENLEKWLKETSEKGSGDDITVGLICNLDKMRDLSKNQILREEKNETNVPETEQQLERNSHTEKKDQIIEWIKPFLNSGESFGI
jgi:serine/threonine protein phosphatase PrpC